MRIAVGAVYQTVTRSLRENAIPGRRVELRFGDDAGHAMRERRDDSITGARHPSGVRRAPEDVVRMQIQRIQPRRIMRDDRLVDVNGAFRATGRPAGEMNERHVVGGCRRNHEFCGGFLRQARPGLRLRLRSLAVDQQDMGELGQSPADRRDLATIQALSGDEDLSPPELEPRRERLRPECREQRRSDAFGFERAEQDM